MIAAPEPHTKPQTGLDHRGERRLSGKESTVWYAIAAVSYIGIGTWEKVLLTWFIGPMWVVGTLTFGPSIYDRIRGRSTVDASRSTPGGSSSAKGPTA